MGVFAEIVKVALTAAAMVYVLRQVRKPDRWLGRLFALMMNGSHSALTDWGLAHLRIEKGFEILDVGCGGGRTVQKLAALASGGRVSGIDYADGSVATSRAVNAQLIRDDRVMIEKASVSKLPFPDDSFDLVTAVETQYYWPDPVNDMREILRVLRAGCTLAVIAESYKNGKHDQVLGPVMRLLGSSRMGVPEHRALFERAGFSGVTIAEETDKGWICVTGVKPVLSQPATPRGS